MPPSPLLELPSPQESARSPQQKKDFPRCDALRVLSAALGLYRSPEGTVTTPPRLPVPTGTREFACNSFYRPSHDCTRVGNRPAEQYAPSAGFLRSYRERPASRCRSNGDPQRQSTGAGAGSHGQAPALSPRRCNDAAVGGPSPGIVPSRPPPL